MINCAGYYELGAIEDMDAETIRNHFQTNVFGMLNVTRHALSQVRRAEGRIINVSSLLGQVSLPFFGVYAATKHSIEAVSEALRYELALHDVEVVVVAPGPTNTGLNERARRQLKSYDSSPYASRYADILQGDGLAGVDPARVARTVVSAVEADSPRNRYSVTLQSRLAPTLQRIVPDALWNRAVTLLIDSNLPVSLRCERSDVARRVLVAGPRWRGRAESDTARMLGLRHSLPIHACPPCPKQEYDW